MGRMTRAKAAEFAEKLHVDEDAVLEMPEHDENAIAKLETPKGDERPPLGEIAPNSGSGLEDEVADMKKSTKGRKTAKKGTKGRKKDLTASTNTETEVEEEEVMPVVEDAAEEACNDERGDEPIDSDAPTITGTTQPEETPSQETLPLRMTRSQVALAQEQQTLPERNEGVEEKDEQEAVEQPSLHIDIQQAEATSPHAAPASPLATATPKVIASLRKDTTGMRSTSNKENEGPSEASIPVPARDASLTPSRSTSNYDALEAAVVEAATPHSVSRRASAAEGHAVESQQVETSLRLEHVNTLLAEQSADAPIESPAPAGQEAPVPENEEAPTKVVTVEPQPVEASPKAENIGNLLSEQPADTPIESPPTQIGQEAPLSAKKDTQQPQMISDPPAATDALKDALEQVASEASQADAPAEKPKPKAKKPAPVVRTTKASAARMSLAQGDKAGAAKASSSARPRPSTARQSTVSKPVAERSQRVPSVGTQKPALEKNEKPTQQKKEATIPHSKPRPVNLSFPTPPPPPKSKKAPTTSTFQLPGEAVAAKLKAAREERMKKEADQPEEKKPSTFKARPAPPALKKTPSVVRQKTSTKARESMVSAKPTGSAPPSAGLKRASTVTAGSTSATTRPKAAVPPRTTAKPEDKSLKVAKRPTTTTSAAAGPTNPSRPSSLTTTTTLTRTSSAPRPSTAGRTGPAPPAASSAAAAPTAPAAHHQQQQQQRILSKGTAKGKEVFSRALLAKEAAGKEKREKEEAARKARELAAERGRQASREWAEKQKGRKLGNGGKRGDGGSGSGKPVVAVAASAASKALGQGTQGTEGAAVLAQGAEEVAVPAGAEA